MGLFYQYSPKKVALYRILVNLAEGVVSPPRIDEYMRVEVGSE